MEPHHIKMRSTAHTRLNFFHLVSSPYSTHTRRTIRTRRYTEVTVDGTRDSDVVDWTKTMHTSSSLRTVERLHELSVDFLLVRGRPPMLVLPEPSMAEAGETLRNGGSSSSGTRSSATQPGPTTVKDDGDTEWTPVTRRRRFRSKTPDPAVIEETKRIWSTAPTPDTGDSTKSGEVLASRGFRGEGFDGRVDGYLDHKREWYS